MKRDALVKEIARLSSENARLRADLARVSEEMGLPPTVGPAAGEIRRMCTISEQMHAELRALREVARAAREVVDRYGRAAKVPR